MTQYIRSLDDRDLSIENAGGKGANLGRMRRAGLPVPAGMVVTVEAWRAVVQGQNLGARIDECWARLEGAGAADLDREAAELSAAFHTATLPGGLADELGAAYSATFEGRAVAVRSSATAEDLPEASFAGQQDTLLNVTGEAALLDAVRRCWASLWTARAMAYRLRLGIAPARVAMAVVVQEMANAEASGVLFTVNPMTGRRGEMMINATWGLGEALVGGRVNPDTIIASRDGRILSSETGEKATRTVPCAGGTREEQVEMGRRTRLCLESRQVEELARLGCECEGLFGGPQDVEWALAEGRIALLQSRPVTAAAPERDPVEDTWIEPSGEGQPFDFWTLQDLGERWPEPVTPLTWSIFEPLTQSSMEAMAPCVAEAWGGRIRWSRRAWGRAFLNEGALLHLYTRGVGMPLSLLGGALTHEGARPQDSERWKPALAVRHLAWFADAAFRWERRVAQFEASFDSIDSAVEAFLDGDVSGLSDSELVDAAETVWLPKLAASFQPHGHATSLAMSALTQMEDFLESALGSAELAQTLGGGISGVIASSMAPELWQMAEALRSAGMADLALTLPAEDALRELRIRQAGGPFRALLQTFLRRHGHRCRSEAELLQPRWVEAQTEVMESVTAFLHRPEPPAAVSGGAAQRRLEAERLVESRLGWMGRARFRFLLRRLHRFTRLRDNGQHYAVKLLLPVRRIYAVLGERWAGREWLEQPRDIFYLTSTEVRMLATGAGGDMDPRAAAAPRRAEHEYWLGSEAPEALDARCVPVLPPAAAGSILTGVAASPGTAAGRACVVLTPSEAARLQPGDILVTRATDPGWTPAFGIISAAVLEIGGALSHGAIVAREYGLPAVVCVPQATQRIRDGQLIRVDGTRGTVSLS